LIVFVPVLLVCLLFVHSFSCFFVVSGSQLFRDLSSIMCVFSAFCPFDLQKTSLLGVDVTDLSAEIIIRDLLKKMPEAFRSCIFSFDYA